MPGYDKQASRFYRQGYPHKALALSQNDNSKNYLARLLGLTGFTFRFLLSLTSSSSNS